MKHRNEKMNEGGQLGIGLQGYTFFVVFFFSKFLLWNIDCEYLRSFNVYPQSIF